MYSLKCKYYTKEFTTLELLLNDVLTSGMDPNYQVTLKGRSIGGTAFDYMVV